MQTIWIVRIPTGYMLKEMYLVMISFRLGLASCRGPFWDAAGCIVMLLCYRIIPRRPSLFGKVVLEASLGNDPYNRQSTRYKLKCQNHANKVGHPKLDRSQKRNIIKSNNRRPKNREMEMTNTAGAVMRSHRSGVIPPTAKSTAYMQERQREGKMLCLPLSISPLLAWEDQ